MAYLQYWLGAQPDGTGKLDAYSSYSAQLLGSLHWWMWLEGAHVVAITVFAGTILFVDLRLLGLALPNVPVSRVSRSLLPLTVGAFAFVVITGVATFYSKPFDYYHHFAFRAKLLFLLLAAANIFIFHGRVQANQAAWDDAARPPVAARRSAALSLLLWTLVIGGGRCMAYERYGCSATTAPLVSALADCEGKSATLALIGKEVSL